jgi:hypothetical protein
MYNTNNTEQSSSIQSGQQAAGRLALAGLRNLIVVLSCSLWVNASLWAADEFGKTQAIIPAAKAQSESSIVGISATHAAVVHAPAQAVNPPEPNEVARVAGPESLNMGVIKAPLEAIRSVASTAVASANSAASGLPRPFVF